MADEQKPLAFFAIAGVTVGRELENGQWQCAVCPSPLSPVECSFVFGTQHQLLEHGQETHGWPKPADCEHPTFRARVDVARLLDAGAFMAEITVQCDVCGVPMRFKGLAAGLSYESPRVSITSEELRAPIEPAIEAQLQAGASFQVPTIPRRH